MRCFVAISAMMLSATLAGAAAGQEGDKPREPPREGRPERAEMRQRMEEAMAKAEKEMAAAKPEAEKPADGAPKKEFEVDFAIADGGGAKQIAGRDTKESVATITVREKGKTLEEAGGLILETHLWMTPKVPALQELNDFRLRYAQAVYGPLVAQAAPNMTQAMAMYPQMKDAMAKLAEHE